MDYNHEKVFDIVLIFGLLVILIVALQMNSPQADVDNSHMSDCLQDSECVLVNANCCGCDNNGTKTAINKYYIGYWNERLYQRCANAYCPRVVSEDSTCSAEAKCLKTKCVVQASL